MFFSNFNFIFAMIHGRMVTIKRRNSIFFHSLITPDINEAEVLILSVNYISACLLNPHA